jgi:hypothetical protein
MNIQTIPIKEYLARKNIPFREVNDELITKCLFAGCDKDSKGNEAHLYFDAGTGQYNCKKCGASGNIITLAKHLGDDIKNVLLNPQESSSQQSQSIQPKPITFDQSLVETCYQSIPDCTRQYLNARGITDAIINDNKLGWGKFYGKQWITIPIKDIDGNFIFLKLRQDPKDGNEKMTYPRGIEAQIYGWETLRNTKDKIVICEGELDRLLLLSKGISAITSTHGAMTFKKEWVEKFEKIKTAYICFDNDEAGKNGAKRLAKMILEINDPKVLIINLPKEVGDGGDITDYFVKLKDNPDDLFNKYAKECSKDKLNNLETREKFHPISLSELLSKKYSPAIWIVEKLIPEECLTVISAPPGLYKTWMGLEIALRVSRGEKVFGEFKTEQGNVILVDEENHGRILQERLLKLKCSSKDKIYFFSIGDSFKVDEEKDLKKLISYGKKTDAKLLIFDSLVRIHDKNENLASSEMSVVMNQFKKLTHEGFTVLFLHHHRKTGFGPNTSDQNIRGSSDILAAVDSHLAIKKTREIIMIQQPKLRIDQNIKPFEVAFEVDPNDFSVSFVYMGEAPEEKTKIEEAKEKILQILEDGSEKDFKALKSITKSGDKSLREALKELIEKGEVSEKSGKKNKKIYRIKDEK